MPYLETVEVGPDKPATASVIWMHGLGADANDFRPIIPQLELSSDLAVRFIFPNAPKRPITINNGMVMRAWYDVTGFDRRDQDEQGIRQSAAWIDELVTHEVDRGIAPQRIVLAGFSQGGAMTLFAGLRRPELLGGLICLSGYLPLDQELEPLAAKMPKPLIFQAHGTADPIVPHILGQQSHQWLLDAGYQVEWHEYPMGHEVCFEEIKHIGDWLTTVFS